VSLDGRGKQLNGGSRYEIRFEKGGVGAQSKLRELLTGAEALIEGERRGPGTHLDRFWDGWLDGFGVAYAAFRRRTGRRRSESRNEISKRGTVMACPGRLRGGGIAERCSGVLPK
jgi:hypothetical protein